VILAVLANRGLEVVEYSPATVKKAVTGNGRASKAQVQGMVYRLLGGATAGGSADAADALAVALCHAVTARYHVAVQRAVRGYR
jgi:crossover junction endodeoxyribonuclease RuvC